MNLNSSSTPDRFDEVYLQGLSSLEKKLAKEPDLIGVERAQALNKFFAEAAKFLGDQKPQNLEGRIGLIKKYTELDRVMNLAADRYSSIFGRLGWGSVDKAYAVCLSSKEGVESTREALIRETAEEMIDAIKEKDQEKVAKMLSLDLPFGNAHWAEIVNAASAGPLSKEELKLLFQIINKEEVRSSVTLPNHLVLYWASSFCQLLIQKREAMGDEDMRNVGQVLGRLFHSNFFHLDPADLGRKGLSERTYERGKALGRSLLALANMQGGDAPTKKTLFKMVMETFNTQERGSKIYEGKRAIDYYEQFLKCSPEGILEIKNVVKAIAKDEERWLTVGKGIVASILAPDYSALMFLNEKLADDKNVAYDWILNNPDKPPPEKIVRDALQFLADTNDEPEREKYVMSLIAFICKLPQRISSYAELANEGNRQIQKGQGVETGLLKALYLLENYESLRIICSLPGEPGEKALEVCLSFDKAHEFISVNDNHILRTVKQLVPSELPNVKLTELKTLFNEINFSAKSKPGFIDPQDLRDEGNPLSVDQLKKNLHLLVERIEKRTPYIGSPKPGPELDAFFKTLSNLLRHTIEAVKELKKTATSENDHLLQASNILIQLATVAGYCGTRHLTEAKQLYSLTHPHTAGAFDLEETILLELQALRQREVHAASKGDVHLYNALMDRLGTALGLSSYAGSYKDPLAPKIDQAAFFKYLKQEYQKELWPHLQQAFEDAPLKDLMIDWIMNHVPEDWEEQKYAAMSAQVQQMLKEQKHPLEIADYLAEKEVAYSVAHTPRALVEQARREAYRASMPANWAGVPNYFELEKQVKEKAPIEIYGILKTKDVPIYLRRSDESYPEFFKRMREKSWMDQIPANWDTGDRKFSKMQSSLANKSKEQVQKLLKQQGISYDPQKDLSPLEAIEEARRASYLESKVNHEGKPFFKPHILHKMLVELKILQS